VTGHTVLGFVPSGLFRMAAFVVGTTFSGLAGFIWMSTAVRGNAPTGDAGRLAAGLGCFSALSVAFFWLLAPSPLAVRLSEAAERPRQVHAGRQEAADDDVGEGPGRGRVAHGVHPSLFGIN